MNWLLFLSQLPANPSSLRVSVWRKLRAAGALGLQNGVWLLPDLPGQATFLNDLLAGVRNQGASGQIFTLAPPDEAAEADILTRFRAEREEEYSELIEHSRAFLGEIEAESARQKFTFAELEENEQDLARLMSWHRKILRRDFTGGESAQTASRTLEECRAAFKIFSAEVYAREAFASTSGDDVADE